MKKTNQHFQHSVDKCLIRHRSIFDSLTKFQEAGARVNRAIAKSATQCGCIKINVSKQKIPDGVKLQDVKKFMDNHIEGEVCPTCREIIQTEIGATFFYIAAICNILSLNMEEILRSEEDRISSLGVYSLT